MADLPPEIFSEILCRVPAITLLRFRCVSKSWRSTIDSPDFIKTHLNQTIRSNSGRKLLLNSRSLYSADFDAFEREDRFVCAELDDHPLKSADAVWVIGSCHGLLCLMKYAPEEEAIEDKGVLLWNPTTRKQFKLPFTGYEFPDNLEYFTWSSCYGFGYDRVSDDYKVLRIIQAYDCYSEVKIFSVKSNSWKKLPPFPYYMQYRGRNGLLVGGSLYWVVCINPEIENENFICAFELATEEFRLVPRPANLSKGKFFMNVVCLRESLCLTCYYHCNYLTVWVQKKDAVEEPLTNMFRIGFNNFVRPVASSGCGHKLLMLLDDNVFIWYDLEKNETVPSPFCISEASGCMEYHVYFGSLVQPSGSSVVWVSDRKRKALGRNGTETTGKKKDDEFLSVGFKLVL